MVLDAPNRRVNDAAAILDACYDLIAVVDDAGEIRSINSATKHLFGKEPTAFIGLKATDLVHPDDLASVAIAFDRLA